MTKIYLRSLLLGERRFIWFEYSFRFNREKYVSYFGQDAVLSKVETVLQ